MTRLRFTASTALDATNMNRILDRSPSANMIRNGDFERWAAGTTSAPDSWEGTANGGTISQSSSAGTFRSGIYGVSLAQTSGGSGDIRITFPAWGRYGIGYQSREVTASVWVKCAAASTAKLRVDDGVSTSESTHTGGGGWERLTAQLTVSASATKLDVILEAAKPGSGSVEAWFDQASLVFGDSEGDWNESPEDRCAEATEFDNNGTEVVVMNPRLITGARTIALSGGAATENATVDFSRGVYSGGLAAVVSLRGTPITANWVRVVLITDTQLTLKFGTFNGTNLGAENVSVYYMVFGSGHADPTDQF